MKLPFDENISYRILKKVKEIFPDSKHTSNISKGLLSDKQIFDYAKAKNLSIVTQDQDFYDLQILYGYPPKIILLRIGNTSTQNILAKLQEKKSELTQFLSNPDFGLIEIY